MFFREKIESKDKENMQTFASCAVSLTFENIEVNSKFLNKNYL